MIITTTLVSSGLAAVGGCTLLVLGYVHKDRAQRTLRNAEHERDMMKKDIEAQRREAHTNLKYELQQKRNEFDQELSQKRQELERWESKLSHWSEKLQQNQQELQTNQEQLQERERSLSRTQDQVRHHEHKLKKLHEELVTKLERISHMTQEEARNELRQTLQAEVLHSQERWMQKVETETKEHARDRAMHIIVDAMQRYTSEQVTAHSAGMIQLPNDEMKGRIIGREGRNIRALEMATGIEIVIGETPEVITISGFNPVRREIARRAIERLIADGRINPTRIEETVSQCEQEIDNIINEKGKAAVMELNLQGVDDEIIRTLGKLHFRTSYSQNVLSHSIEVAQLTRMLAQEVGLDRPDIAARAGLFHDMGKALSEEHEGPHAIVGAELAKRCGEDAYVVNAIAAHHEERSFISLYDPLVIIADTISASRPGARRETLSAYIKRLEKLEEMANSFEGVKKAYALQAGREVRVLVEESTVSDDDAHQLARHVAKNIEEHVSYPGQVKVNVIRENRSIEYAR